MYCIVHVHVHVLYIDGGDIMDQHAAYNIHTYKSAVRDAKNPSLPTHFAKMLADLIAPKTNNSKFGLDLSKKNKKKGQIPSLVLTNS